MLNLVLASAPASISAPHRFELYRPHPHPARFSVPLFLSTVRAGFPSPADDYVDTNLDLNTHLIAHPSATFMLRVEGDSMEPLIHAGDLLIADRSVQARHNSVVVAIVDGEFLVKRLHQRSGRVCLVADNPRYPPLQIREEMRFEVWGVITSVIHSV